MSKKKEKEYQRGRVVDMVHFIAETYNLDDRELRKKLGDTFPELRDPSRCANCGESMAVYIYSLSVLDAELLCSLAKVVTQRMQKGMTFTEANKVHLQTEIGDYTLASRQTIASKLGLVAKVKTKDGKHDRRAGWCITTRGYEFLAGKPVPKKVKVFHNQIQEHFEDMITMSDLFSGSSTKMGDWREVAGVFVSEYEAPRLL